MSAGAIDKLLLATFSALLALSGVAVKSEPSTSDRGQLLDEGLSWQRCGPEAKSFNAEVDHSSGFDATLIDADALEYHKNNEVAVFTGDVSVGKGSKQLLADWARYDKTTERTEVRGDVFYRDPKLRLLADEGEFFLKDNRGSLTNVRAFRLPSAGARGSASKAIMHDKDRNTFVGASYTTCRPGNEDWNLTADKVDIDKAEGVGVARNATVRFKGVPLLYAPYFSFPVDKRRKSGFLMPTIGGLSSTGLDVTAPYYLNLAPNYDATLNPRYMSDHGIMLGGEFRHMGEKAYTVFRGEVIDDRRPPSGEDSLRGSVSLRHTSWTSPRWYNRIQADNISDKSYITDFGSNLGVTSKVNLERTAESIYYGDFWNLTARVQNFQTVDRLMPANAQAYSRLPQLVLNASVPTPSGITYGLAGEYVAFDRQDSLTGQRLDLMPSIGYALYRPWGFARPKLSARYTGYQLENLNRTNPNSGLTNANPDRFLPTFSFDSGLYFDRDTSWFGQAATQTLEPRLFYLNTPYENQNDLPLFDTGLYGLSFDNLFRENRFVGGIGSGADRVGDANQLTTAVTSRLFAQDTGEEWLSASLGQIHYFRDRKVQLPGATITTTDTLSSSSMMGELSSQVTPDLKLRTFLQWDTEQNDSEKSVAEMRYKDENRRIVNLAYRHEDKVQKQVDAAFYLPLNTNWNLIGRWNYSIQDERTLDRFAGFEYDSCCWALRFVGRHFVNDKGKDSKVDTTTGVFVQLELKGLGSIGNKADKVIADGVLGYAVER